MLRPPGCKGQWSRTYEQGQLESTAVGRFDFNLVVMLAPSSQNTQTNTEEEAPRVIRKSTIDTAQNGNKKHASLECAFWSAIIIINLPVHRHFASRSMFVFWTSEKKPNRVMFGKKKKLLCGNCNIEATFHECNIDEGLKLYSVIEVWKRTKRVMQCGECLAVCDFYDVYPEEKEAQEEAEAERKQKEKDQKQQAEMHKRQQQEQQAAAAKQREADERQRLEEEQRKAEEIAQIKREAQRKEQEIKVDDDLAKLKRDLGKS